MTRCCFALFLALSLLGNALCLPQNIMFRKRRNTSDNKVGPDSSPPTKYKDLSSTDAAKPAASSDEDDDFGDDDFKPTTSSNGGGSNIFSLLNLARAFLPSLSGSNSVKKNNEFITKTIRDIIKQYQARTAQKRQDIIDNIIEIEYPSELKPLSFERQESVEGTDEDSEESESDSEEDNGAEESVEEPISENGGSKPKQDSGSDSNSNSDDDNDSDYDEPPGGDGQGGGILGLLAGISGDGESDLGSLLATVGGIVANLSGDGIDLNALIATGLGLFVGLLSDENSNPGEVIASYLLTSLDTISGGGAKNNGAFFGKLLSTLVKGASAGDSGSASEENGGMKMADSAGFFLSLLMGLFGDMSKQSSGGSSWR